MRQAEVDVGAGRRPEGVRQVHTEAVVLAVRSLRLDADREHELRGPLAVDDLRRGKADCGELAEER